MQLFYAPQIFFALGLLSDPWLTWWSWNSTQFCKLAKITSQSRRNKVRMPYIYFSLFGSYVICHMKLQHVKISYSLVNHTKIFKSKKYEFRLRGNLLHFFYTSFWWVYCLLLLKIRVFTIWAFSRKSFALASYAYWLWDWSKGWNHSKPYAILFCNRTMDFLKLGSGGGCVFTFRGLLSS